MKNLKATVLTKAAPILGSVLSSLKPRHQSSDQKTNERQNSVQVLNQNDGLNGSINLKITGLTNNKGNVVIGLYKGAEGFTEYDKNYKNGLVPSSKGTVEFNFNDIPEGEYALALWQDENDNKKLDKNMLGIPKEKYGFSNNKFGKFGPPKYEDVKFQMNKKETVNMTIHLK